MEGRTEGTTQVHRLSTAPNSALPGLLDSPLFPLPFSAPQLRPESSSYAFFFRALCLNRKIKAKFVFQTPQAECFSLTASNSTSRKLFELQLLPFSLLHLTQTIFFSSNKNWKSSFRNRKRVFLSFSLFFPRSLSYHFFFRTTKPLTGGSSTPFQLPFLGLSLFRNPQKKKIEISLEGFKASQHPSLFNSFLLVR